jgi:hypothetical protein
MTLYIGDKPVGLYRVVKDTKYIDKTKFGVSIEDIMGFVDENGAYQKPNSQHVVLDLTGVKTVYDYQFAYLFRSNSSTNGIKEIVINAPDLTSVGEAAFLSAACARTLTKATLKCDALENITSQKAFDGLFNDALWGDGPELDISFASLKTISASGRVFYGAFKNSPTIICMDKSFPVLESVSGLGLFASLSRGTYIFSKITTIVGQTSRASATFYNCPGIYCFPRATSFSKYIFYNNYPVLHFAAANQAAIEACTGYDYKFGASEIYFDLMLTIVVNGVTYSRHQTIDGYTSWVDESGNTVYTYTGTDAPVEPTVDTPVYSDQGTTQVGTVSEAA